jgi:Zn-finger nucleic acid-binding protein
MRYITPCPNCHTELRFPIDRGVLIVKCPVCSNSFQINPDLPEVFKSGRFELKSNYTQNRKESFSTKEFFEDFPIQKIVRYVLFFLAFLYLGKFVIWIERGVAPIYIERPSEKRSIPIPPSEKDDSYDSPDPESPKNSRPGATTEI